MEIRDFFVPLSPNDENGILFEHREYHAQFR